MSKKLSKKNYNKLNENFLYKSSPEKFDEWKDDDDPYWCRNWTFRVKKYEDGRAFMVDTFYETDSIEVTDENIDKFEKVFDFREVREIRGDEKDEYDPEDVFCVPLGSGGRRFGMHFFVKKTATKNIDLQVRKKEEEIRHLENELSRAKRELKLLLKRGE